VFLTADSRLLRARFYEIAIGAATVPVEQLTVTDPVPVLVDGAITQLQEARPSGPVVVAADEPCPLAVLVVPAGVTYCTEQFAPGVVWIVTDALPP
jgi:hypothetical protein